MSESAPGRADGSTDSNDKDLSVCPTCGEDFGTKRNMGDHHAKAHPGKFADRLWHFVDVGNEDECWEWLKSTSDDGYGQISHKSKNKRPHRLAYELEYGEIDGEYICHHCDNPICCNPNHLFAGSQSDNIKDAYEKGRISRRGNDSYVRKLCRDDVVEIKQRLQGDEYHREIAEDYPVTRSAICHISNENQWSRVDVD